MELGTITATETGSTTLLTFSNTVKKSNSSRHENGSVQPQFIHSNIAVLLSHCRQDLEFYTVLNRMEGVRVVLISLLMFEAFSKCSTEQKSFECSTDLALHSITLLDSSLGPGA